ncbi:MAG: endonuclease III [Oscillospiraceae bacterium]|nr:endonuclease III [Oscillospiraceae bacterium]MCR4761371.1 endonuclease III [Oscillospiraceae bacterium]
MTKLQEKAVQICDILDTVYPDAVCSLQFEKPYELMIATRLSAQCTDARVNIVTKTLFKQYPTLESFADADLAELEKAVHPCGFYKAKAKSIKEMCQRVRDDFGGVVPDNMDDLLTLPGIGRKTANLLLGDVYGQPSVVTDTHCIRICGRLGLTKRHAPEQVEADLRKVLPPERSGRFCHQIVLFGRDTCTARNPKCHGCPLESFCVDPGFTKNPKKSEKRVDK